MQTQVMQRAVLGIAVLGWGLLVALLPLSAAPYAAMVMDARNGEVIHARNHDTKLHPASLTKMMTLYIAFEAVKHGEVGLDTKFKTSRRATRQECVCLGLKQGQRISLRHLIRAAALRSANDAAVVIAEGISGSVEAFAKRMTRTARAMGMRNTTFKNPHGLTQSGHVSTARDMTRLGRQLFFDYPQYFNIFSRRSDFAGVGTVPNTNRRFLNAYRGANGIKTGYTRAAGFNLTASAQRGSKHIIATMFGGSSTAARNARVAELLDMGFSRAKTRVAERKPATPAYRPGGSRVATAPRNGDDDPNAGAKTIRLVTAVRKSLRPRARPAPQLSDDLLVAVTEGVDMSVAETAEDLSLAQLAPEALDISPPPRPAAAPQAQADAPGIADALDMAVARAAGFAVAAAEDLAALSPDADVEALDAQGPDTETRNATDQPASVSRDADASDMSRTADAVNGGALDGLAIGMSDPASEHVETAAHTAQDDGPAPEMLWTGAPESFLPAPVDSAVDLNADLTVPDTPVQRADSGIILTRKDTTEQDLATALVSESFNAEAPQVVSRVSTSDAGRLWGVSLGAFNSRHAAERSLITVRMAESHALASGISRVRQVSGRFEASFAGLTRAEADRACARLAARGMECAVDQP